MYNTLIRPGQKSTVRLKDIAQKLKKQGTLAVDASDGTFTVTKGRMLLLRSKKFILCKVDSICLTEALPQLILLYAQ